MEMANTRRDMVQKDKRALLFWLLIVTQDAIQYVQTLTLEQMTGEEDETIQMKERKKEEKPISFKRKIVAKQKAE